MASRLDNVIIAWGFELAGLGLVAFIANTSEDTGTIMVTVMIGLWLVFLIMRPDILRGINNLVGYSAKAARGG